MYFTPETLSDEAIEKAGSIALEAGLPIKDVAAIIETLMIAPLPESAVAEETILLAAALRPIMEQIHGPVCELQRFAFFGLGGNAMSRSYITLPVLAAATGSYRFDALVCLRDILLTAARNAAAFDSVDVVQDPRRAMIVAKMATAGYFWWDMFDEFPTGEFEMTEGGLQPTPDSGLEFVVRMMDAADPGVTMDELADCVTDMRDAIGMTGFLKEMAEQEADEAAEREAHLRVVD